MYLKKRLLYNNEKLYTLSAHGNKIPYFVMTKYTLFKTDVLILNINRIMTFIFKAIQLFHANFKLRTKKGTCFSF